MRLKNVPGSREAIEECKYVIKEEPAEGVATEPENENGRKVLGNWKIKGNWKEEFGNANPIHIEIGMGKGRFVTELAKQNPEINYVGIEKFSSVLVRAVQKQDELQLPNLRFVRMDAEYINDVFKEGEVDKIYLNFSDPWPKSRHAKRRLTSKEYLKRYEKLLKDKGLVEFKTDNVSLFNFSLEEAPLADWEILAYTRDLHKSGNIVEEEIPEGEKYTDDKRTFEGRDLADGNIKTEYEAKFSGKGKAICKLVMRKK